MAKTTLKLVIILSPKTSDFNNNEQCESLQCSVNWLWREMLIFHINKVKFREKGKKVHTIWNSFEHTSSLANLKGNPKGDKTSVCIQEAQPITIEDKFLRVLQSEWQFHIIAVLKNEITPNNCCVNMIYSLTEDVLSLLFTKQNWSRQHEIKVRVGSETSIW